MTPPFDLPSKQNHSVGQEHQSEDGDRTPTRLHNDGMLQEHHTEDGDRTPTRLQNGAMLQENPTGDGDRTPKRLYKNVRVQDQARLHNGDQYYYGPVSFQDGAKTPATASHDQEKERENILSSLVFDQMDSRFMDVSPNLVGTCEWLLNTPEYKSWQDPSKIPAHHGFLWIKGHAGTGKSTLVKYALDLTEARSVGGEHALIFFFNARGGPMESSPDGLFRSLLHQILEKIPRLFDLLD